MSQNCPEIYQKLCPEISFLAVGIPAVAGNKQVCKHKQNVSLLCFFTFLSLACLADNFIALLIFSNICKLEIAVMMPSYCTAAVRVYIPVDVSSHSVYLLL